MTKKKKKKKKKPISQKHKRALRIPTISSVQVNFSVVKRLLRVKDPLSIRCPPPLVVASFESMMRFFSHGGLSELLRKASSTTDFQVQKLQCVSILAQIQKKVNPPHPLPPLLASQPLKNANTTSHLKTESKPIRSSITLSLYHPDRRPRLVTSPMSVPPRVTSRASKQ